MGHPFEGWSKLNEGWDGGDVAIDELIENTKTVLNNSLGPVLVAFAMIWGLKIAISLIVGALGALGVWVMGVFGTIGGIVGFLAIPVLILVSLVQNALFRPIQLQAFEGKEFIGSAGEALGMAREVIVKVVLTSALFGVVTSVGFVFCVVPGLAALFFFCQAPYLAATTELPPWECMRRSYELNKTYALPVAIALAAALVVSGVMGGCGGGASGFVGGLVAKLSPPVGSLVGTLGSDIFSMVGGFGTLVAFGAVFTTIQSLERGVPFKRAEGLTGEPPMLEGGA
jgi:hypothetical protein